jgi:hypothetical protein
LLAVAVVVQVITTLAEAAAAVQEGIEPAVHLLLQQVILTM